MDFFNPKEFENGFCVSLVDSLIQDLSDRGASKEPNRTWIFLKKRTPSYNCLFSELITNFIRSMDASSLHLAYRCWLLFLEFPLVDIFSDGQTDRQTDRQTVSLNRKSVTALFLSSSFSTKILDNELEITMKWLIVVDPEGRINYTALEISKAYNLIELQKSNWNFTNYSFHFLFYSLKVLMDF